MAHSSLTQSFPITKSRTILKEDERNRHILYETEDIQIKLTMMMHFIDLDEETFKWDDFYQISSRQYQSIWRIFCSQFWGESESANQVLTKKEKHGMI